MFIVLPNPNSYGGELHKHLRSTPHQKYVKDLITEVAAASGASEICVYRMTELVYCKTEVKQNKFIVTEKGEVIPA